MRMRTLTVVSLLLVFSWSAPASHHHRSTTPRGHAGRFDYYVFVLSWSPEFCHSKPDSAQCSQHCGFIVHGLWPQNNDGTYPQHCVTSQPGPTNPSSMADIIPQEIVQHEWQTHGTCSGLSGDNYFALIRKLHSSLRIPQKLQAPSSAFVTRSAEVKSGFEQVNPGLNDGELVVQLRQGYLNAVEFCVDKSNTPAPVACTGLYDTSRGTFRVPPVQ